MALVGEQPQTQSGRRWTSHLERRAIEYVPPEERHGHVRDQLTVWFGANSTALNLFFGSLAITLGVSFVWTIYAIVLGTVLGALVTSFHALQGPKLGVPQLLQSRGQFGYYGAVLFFVAFIVVEFGFMASQLVIQAYSMNQVVPSIGIPVWALIAAVPVALLAIFGYDWVHRWQRIATIGLTITVVVMLIEALTFHGHVVHANARPSVALFFLVTVVFIINIAGWAPNVSDYSRYLPESTRFAPAFWAVFVGNVLPTVVFAIVGAYITSLLPHATLYAAVQRVTGSWALVLMAISLTGTNTFNVYTGMLSIVSTVDTFKKVNRTVLFRIVGIFAMVIAAVLAAVLGYRSFVDNFVNFLDVLIFVFFPWSAINLADFYLVRHGHYDVQEFFDPNGIYGKVQVRTALCYVVGLVVELLFVSQTFYSGPLLSSVGGVDISWILGFVVPFGLYWAIARRGRAGQLATLPSTA